VRQLYPAALDPVDPAEVYGDLPDAGSRPALRLNMIASADGATTLAGTSGGLGGPADRALFLLLRSLADVVLVAAGTVRADGYGPSSVPVAVVSRSCRFDWDAPFFSAQKARPIVVTVADAPAPLRARAAEVAEVVVAGERDVDLARALDELGAMGFRAVLAEGGPTLNAQLAAAGLIDELCLTLAPTLVGGAAKRLLDGPPLAAPTPLRLRSVCEQDGFLFLRWRRGPATPR
jgi:riboflavin biosynthesis pyrimidine reductase